LFEKGKRKRTEGNGMSCGGMLDARKVEKYEEIMGNSPIIATYWEIKHKSYKLSVDGNAWRSKNLYKNKKDGGKIVSLYVFSFE
jgi:hypothetical protein